MAEAVYWQISVATEQSLPLTKNMSTTTRQHKNDMYKHTFGLTIATQKRGVAYNSIVGVLHLCCDQCEHDIDECRVLKCRLHGSLSGF